jgi:hypothetical protein
MCLASGLLPFRQHCYSREHDITGDANGMTRNWPQERGTALPLKALSIVALMAALVGVSSAMALDPQSEEAQTLKACDQRLCTMLIQKKTNGDDLDCELTKTWARSTIKGADSPTLSWGFGDARCSVHLHLSRALVVAAVTNKENKLFVPPHTANCVIEQSGELKTIKATLSPKIVFKEGRAEKIWINLISVDGTAAIKDLLWAFAQLEDKTGLFHHVMVKAVNKFIYVQCPKRYPQAVPAPATTAAKDSQRGDGSGTSPPPSKGGS